MPDVVEQIKKLSPKREDILVMRLEDGCSPEWLQAISDKMREHGIDCIIITLADDSDIYVLNEEMMGEFGWVKKAKMLSLGETG